jgi:hypothetical protein
VNATSDGLLLSLREELLEKKRQVAHYTRLTTSLELQLETIDRQQKRAYRRVEELADEIEREEVRLARAQLLAPTRRRVAVG